MYSKSQKSRFTDKKRQPIIKDSDNGPKLKRMQTIGNSLFQTQVNPKKNIFKQQIAQSFGATND